jgi:hypothetical protein
LAVCQEPRNQIFQIFRKLNFVLAHTAIVGTLFRVTVRVCHERKSHNFFSERCRRASCETNRLSLMTLSFRSLAGSDTVGKGGLI